MESPMCPSQYFVNKQNVRSSRNIIKCNLKSYSEFVKILCGNEEDLLKYLTQELESVFFTILENTRVKAKEDFKCYFAVENKLKYLVPVDKVYVFEKIWNIVNEIITTKFCGNNHNVKVLRNLVHCIIYSMRRQNILLKKIIENWDFNAGPWKNIPEYEVKKILYHSITWIIKNILAAAISLNFYVTTSKADANENMLHYFWKDQWQSFYDKKIAEMIFTKVIKKCESLSLGKKIKNQKDVYEKRKIRAQKKNIPKLCLILKSNNDYRPIVQYRSDSQNNSEKYKIKERLKFLRTLTGKPNMKIETEFKNLHENWIKAGKSKLYFVKTDLSNAFGCVNNEVLLKIICERHLKFQKEEKDLNFKKRMASQYKEMMNELRKPFLVRAGSTVFEWQHGLIQGYKYSPALSELYYTHMDEIYFLDHFKNSDTQNKIFIRVVDDYMYITDSLADANSFLQALTNYQNVNYKKTVVNFEHPHIQFSEDITFLGYSYDTEKLQVSRASNVYSGQMCYKIAFTSAIDNIQMFLENRIGQSGIQINGHIFNFFYNSEELIWRHIFMTFCLSANKFCTILAILCQEQEMVSYLTTYKKKVVVKLTNAMLETLLKNSAANFRFVYCINHFRNLAWRGLYLCAKSSQKCSILIPKINDELAKTNCLFGKWRDHASGINSNGEIFKTAIKEVCRRTEVKTIVKSFSCLPYGFECYNKRNCK